MGRYWSNLANAGTPNGPSLAPWPRYDAAKDTTFVLDTTSAPVDGVHASTCGFWDETFPDY
jgi:carboxylesterase type B